jgi:hypothetical protein
MEARRRRYFVLCNHVATTINQMVTSADWPALHQCGRPVRYSWMVGSPVSEPPTGTRPPGAPAPPNGGGGSMGASIMLPVNHSPWQARVYSTSVTNSALTWSRAGEEYLWQSSQVAVA